MSDLDLGDPASWRPIEEFPGQLFTERTWLVGAIILGVAYGVELTLFSQCMTLLVKQTKRGSFKSTMPLIVYITCLFICGSIFMGAAANMARLSFIDNRNIPGGPSIYETVMFSIPVDNQGNAAFVIANWLADGLMAWRWFVIYRTCKLHIAIVMFIPIATLTTSFIMGTLFLVQVSAPASSIWATNSINFTLPYFCISLALNIVSTIAIVSRLLYYRHRTASTLGTAHGTQYTTIASMLVESAAVYSTSSLLFLVPFIVGHPIQNVFLGLLSPAQVIAPLMIIYRVAQGRAWATNTATTIMTKNGSNGMPMSKLSAFNAKASGGVSSGGTTLIKGSRGQDFYLEEGRVESTPEFKQAGSI